MGDAGVDRSVGAMCLFSENFFAEAGPGVTRFRSAAARGKIHGERNLAVDLLRRRQRGESESGMTDDEIGFPRLTAR
jgi:hypothetical protein